MTKPEPEPPVESLQPPDTQRQRRLGCGIVVAVLLAGVGYFVWDQATSDAESVVADFFDAVIAKDVDEALGYVADYGSGAPSAEEAVFLDPKAIAEGWELLDTQQNVDGPESDGVKVTLGNGEERQTGIVEVDNVNGEWKLDDPFVRVSIAGGPLTFLQVNDKIVELERLYAHDVTVPNGVEYRLFPGLNRFFGDLKASSTKADPGKLLFPNQDGYSDVVPVRQPDLKLTPRALDEFQKSVNDVIDDCTEFRVRQPLACPFGVESTFSTDEDHRYEDIHDITWSVNEYPKATVAEPESEGGFSWGAPIGWEDPGEVALSATATLDDDTGKSVKLKAECEFSAEQMRVGFGPDGKPRVYSPPLNGFLVNVAAFPLDTCQQTYDQDEE